MLDQEMKEQLQSVFEKLDSKVILNLANTTHPDQADLSALLADVASTSSNLELVTNQISSPHKDEAPYFEIHTENKQTGVAFAGIPTGHEFTSLILAILNANNKGKLPDEKTQSRIRALKGSLRLRTYVSLTCENCPEVVQALNLMALIHPDFKHEMADGQYFQSDIDRLGIMGVPTVTQGDTILHSGRANLAQLLDKLEEQVGIDTEKQVKLEAQDLGSFDVVVIGGGPAGASSAIYTIRKGLKTALIAEKFGGQVSETRGIENLISVPYTEGPELSAALYKHVTHYPIEVIDQQRVKNIENQDGSKRLLLESGDYLSAKSVIVATGAKWRELGVPGEKEYMGRGVAYCPHCDGPFYKGKTVAVIGGGNSGVEAAIDLAGIVAKVILIEYNEELRADKILVDKLKSLPNVTIMTSLQTQSVVGDGKKVQALEYIHRINQEKGQVELDGVFIQIGLIPNSQFLKGSVELSKFGEIIIDEKCRTSTPGIYAAGDVTTVPYKQIIISMGEGAKAGLSAFEDLVYHK